MRGAVGRIRYLAHLGGAQGLGPIGRRRAECCPMFVLHTKTPLLVNT
jgi:hypothetical protein